MYETKVLVLLEGNGGEITNAPTRRHFITEDEIGSEAGRLIGF
jgi:hypothetical protein